MHLYRLYLDARSCLYLLMLYIFSCCQMHMEVFSISLTQIHRDDSMMTLKALELSLWMQLHAVNQTVGC